MSTPGSRRSFFGAFGFSPSPPHQKRMREVEQGIVEREVREAYAEIRRRRDVLEGLLARAKRAKGAEFAEHQRMAQAAENRVRDAEAHRDVLIEAARDEGFVPPVYRGGSGAGMPDPGVRRHR